VTANEPRLSVYLVPHLDPLCVAPCEASLSPGWHQLAFAHDVGRETYLSRNRQYALSEPIDLRVDTTLSVRYVDNQPTRLVGMIVGTVAMVAGTMLLMVDLFNDTDGFALSIIGASMLIVGLILELALGLVDDRVEVTDGHGQIRF